MDRDLLVSALLVTYESAGEVEACLDSLLAQELPGPLEVVAADNASSDDSLAVLRRYPAVDVIARAANDGYAPAVNAAFARSHAPYVLLLNPDVVIEDGCLAALLAHLEHEPSAGAAAAWLLEEDGSPQRFARRDVRVRDVALTMTLAGRRFDARRGGRALRHRTYADEWERGGDAVLSVDCPAAACVLVRRELLLPRPYDERLPLFYNDAELWRRAQRAGWRLDVVRAARARHGGGVSVRRVDAVRMRAEWVAATRRYARLTMGAPRAGAVTALFALDGMWSLATARDQDARVHARGTLGGVGLPGGPPPWLTPVRRLLPTRAAR